MQKVFFEGYCLLDCDFPSKFKNPEGSVLKMFKFLAGEKTLSKPTVQGLDKAQGVSLQENMLSFGIY